MTHGRIGILGKSCDSLMTFKKFAPTKCQDISQKADMSLTRSENLKLQ